MKASPRNKRIVFEARTTVEDEYGGEEEVWAELAAEYAAVYYGNGTEQREAAQGGGSQAASFEVLSNSKTRVISVTDHRITFDDGIWNITGAHDLDNGGRRITAIRAAV